MIFRGGESKINTPRHKSLLLGFSLIWLCLTVWVLSSLPSYADHKSQILFISSYNSRFPTFFKQINGLKSVLPEDDFVIDLEFMDAKRFNTEDNVESFKERLSYKLSLEQPYDLIIVSDDNALRFVLDHRSELFSNIPIVFFGINDQSLAESANAMPDVTGVFEHVSVDHTLALAQKLLPTAKNVYAIVDDTLAGQGDLASYYSIAPLFPTLEFHDIDMRKLTFDDLKARLKTFTSDDIIILLAAYDDAAGTTLSFEDIVEIINTNASVPVFHLYEHGVGDGLLGGCVISHFTQGQAAGEIVYSILHDQKPISTIDVLMESPNTYMLDYEITKAYDLNISSLPFDIEWQNKEVSFLDTYFNLIVLVTCIFVGLIFFTSYLLYYIKKAKDIERSLQDRTDELKDLYDELSASEEELRAQNDELMETQAQLRKQKSELLRKQKLIEDYAYYDFLTHLPNRYSLKLDILKLLEKQSPSSIKGAIFFIDFDNFKAVNDHYGHSYGDALLVEISRRLEHQLADSGKVYRFGGDEFVAMIDASCDFETIDFIAKKLIDAFGAPIMIKDISFRVTFSMGIALIPLHGNDFDSLIGSADMAMYCAKNAGKNCYQFFDESERSKTNSLHLLRNELSDAITDNQLMLNYQPIYSDGDQHIHFAEAMLRWHRTEGAISPAEFIPIAVDMGVMTELTRFVFEEVFDILNVINSGSQNTYITINISNDEILNNILISEIEQLLLKTKANAQWVCLEVSETLIESNFELVQKQIDALQKLGFRIIIDNFGSEYLSLNYLKKLPIDFVKMDISLFTDTSSNRKILTSLIHILRELNILIIIKNVESEAHLEYLADIDSDYVQGHYYSYPVTRDQLIRMILDEDIKIYQPSAH